MSALYAPNGFILTDVLGGALDPGWSGERGRKGPTRCGPGHAIADVATVVGWIGTASTPGGQL
ncbi:MAG: hypothetical protein GX620_06660 [Chloroflexi bacterium]|nr:hypothetical protein [Chloroflexota bacterium]